MASVGPVFLKALAGDYVQLRPLPTEDPQVVWERMVRCTANHLAGANPNFDFARFYEASGLWPSAVH